MDSDNAQSTSPNWYIARVRYLFFLSLALQPFCTVAQPSLQVFKELLSSPPAIEEIIAERRYSGTKPTDYYYGRWQSNAFLLSISTNRQKVEVGGMPSDLTQVYARFDDSLWQVFGANRPLKIGTLDSLSTNNELIVGTYWASVDLGRLLNFGIDHLKPGQIRWIGNTYTGTNDSGKAAVSGEAKTNTSGQITQVSMNISVWPDSPLPGVDLPRKYKWEIEYEYGDSISNLYPSVIKRYVMRPKDRFLRDEIHIHSVKLARVPLKHESFKYEPFLFADSWILRATNDTFYYIGSNGIARPVLQGIPVKESVRSWFLF